MANIGKLALTVTANAAPLTKDLDAIEKKTAATGKAVEKNLKAGGEGGGGPGLFAFLGGAAGAAAVAAIGAIGKGLGMALGLMESVRAEAGKLGVFFSAIDSDKIDQANRSFGQLKGVALGLFGQVLAAAEPAITAVSGVLMDFIRQATPAIVWLTDKVGTGLAYAFKAVFGFVEIVVKQVVALWESFAGAEAVASFFDKFPDWGSIVKAVLKGMAIGFAYVWDTVKAGAGMAISSFGKLAEVVGNVAKRLGFDWGEQVRSIGLAAQATGNKMVFSFGKTHDEVNKLFDDIDKRAASGPAKFVPYQATAALIAGSTQEYSVRAKFAMEGKLNPQLDVQKQQLQEQKRGNDLLNKLVREAERDRPLLEVI
jgi:hypothetical protein